MEEAQSVEQEVGESAGMRRTDLGLAEWAHESGQAVGMSALHGCGGASLLARGTGREETSAQVVEKCVEVNVTGKSRGDRGRNQEIARDRRESEGSGLDSHGFGCHYPLLPPSPSPSPSKDIKNFRASPGLRGLAEPFIDSNKKSVSLPWGCGGRHGCLPPCRPYPPFAACW